MRVTADTPSNAGWRDDPAPGGIPRTRLAWLCQPEQIERTLRLLSSLDRWAKARERLLYADRQGLYRVKAAIVRQAFVSCLLRPVSYTDGSVGFAREFSLDHAADIAAVCPYRLIEKQEYVSQLARRYPYWDGDRDDDGEEDGWDDEDYEALPRRAGQRHEVGRAPGACPLCAGAVEPWRLETLATAVRESQQCASGD